MGNLKELPYAAWLEGSLQNIVTSSVQSMCILTKTDKGEVGVGYFDCAAIDKLLFASYLQHDAVIDTMTTNNTAEDDEGDEEDYG